MFNKIKHLGGGAFLLLKYFTFDEKFVVQIKCLNWLYVLTQGTYKTKGSLNGSFKASAKASFQASIFVSIAPLRGDGLGT